MNFPFIFPNSNENKKEEKKMNLKSLVLGIFACSMGHMALAQQTVEWDANSSRALGNGCPNGSVAFIAAGNDVTVLFSELGVDMPSGGGAALQETKNCTIVIPAQVARGLYLADLSQNLNYSVMKTAGSEGSISTQSVFFNNAVSPVSAYHPRGEYQQPARDVNLSRTDTFVVSAPVWSRFWCGMARSLRGNFQSRIRVSGSRDHFGEGILMVADRKSVV